MLNAYPRTIDKEHKAWIDLISPSDVEIKEVEQSYGVKIPDLASLREIETSSRFRADGETLYMSSPMIAGVEANHWRFAPTGFILTPKILITLRSSDLASFATVALELGNDVDLTPALALTRILEEVVDRTADHLEHASDIVSEISEALFFSDDQSAGLSRQTRKMRALMRRIGQASDRASRVRYTFLSVGRMVSFVLDRCTPKLDASMNERLEAMRHDILSLDEFEASLSGRIQLLQDTATAFISIEQNDVVKVLTVASVVGVPPVLVVGIYGMNFRYMPELGWHFGYPMALALCLISALIPYLWFKYRNWL